VGTVTDRMMPQRRFIGRRLEQLGG
jgi:hypothetical protein